MNIFKTDNAIIAFLINFFLLECIGKIIFLVFIWTCRFFGMPGPYIYYSEHPIINPIIFTILLIVAVVVSIVQILKKKKSIQNADNNE